MISPADAAATEGKKPTLLVAKLSIAAPLVAYSLTVLPHLGMKSLLLFYYFATWTRIIGAGAGVLLGIIACVYAGSWDRAKIGVIGIVLGIAGFVTALYLAIPKSG